MKKPFALGTMCFVLPVLLAACSAPVTLETDQGPVTCQLYTEDQVTWDQATAHPQTMTKATADELCRQEGFRRLAQG